MLSIVGPLVTSTSYLHPSLLIAESMISGFYCSYGLLFGSLYQGCYSLATSTTFAAASCINSGTNFTSTFLSSTLNVTISAVPSAESQNFQAPLLQLVYQMSDLQNLSSSSHGYVTTNPANTNPSSAPPNTHKVSGGAIAGIVVGAIAGFGCLLALVWILLWQRQRRKKTANIKPSGSMQRINVELAGQANQLHEANEQDIGELPQGLINLAHELDAPNPAHELHSDAKVKAPPGKVGAP